MWFHLQAAKRKHAKRFDKRMTTEEELQAKEMLMVFFFMTIWYWSVIILLG